MKPKVCPYCSEDFIPSRYHPEQTICGSPQCQRRRQSEYHRKKIAEDPSYRALCAESQTYWKEKNPDYAKRRRAKKGSAGSPSESAIDELLRLLRKAKNNSAKNNMAVGVTRCCVEVIWVNGPGGSTEGNNLANAKLIIIQGDVHVGG